MFFAFAVLTGALVNTGYAVDSAMKREWVGLSIHSVLTVIGTVCALALLVH